MIKPIADRLKAEEQDEGLVKLRDEVLRLVKGSRKEMSKRYPKWDRNNEIYMGLAKKDEEDVKSELHDEPEKLVVPMSFAQVQTFVAFTFLLFTQNRRFFEFKATGAEDSELREDCEEVLERDLRVNKWYGILYQLLLDAARFNLGVVKHWWSKEVQFFPQEVPAIETVVDGINFTTASTVVDTEFVKFEGNRLSNISPYNFFPDTRFPLRDWQRGNFVADETEWHVNQLKEWQRAGQMFGVEHVEKMDKSVFKERGDTRLDALKQSMTPGKGSDEDDMIVCLTECQMKLVPKDYELGPEEYPVNYVVQVANDQRIVQVKPLGYIHGEWTYDVAQFSADMHQRLGESLSDTIDPLQVVVSYLINSRLASVKRSLENNLVIDPSGVNMESVESRSPYITMKKGSPRLGVDKFIRQLTFVDTTASHMADADTIMRIMQTVTGVNENSMGQFTGGRRSATEARAVNSGAASRSKVTATIIWSDCIESLGRKMLMNERYGISERSFEKILGPAAMPRYSKFHPQDLSELIGSEDFFVFDGTLQSEKGFIAQSLQELVSAMISNPIVMQALPLDIGMLMEEVLLLRGIEDVERFRVQPPPQLPLDPNAGGPIIPEQEQPAAPIGA